MSDANGETSAAEAAYSKALLDRVAKLADKHSQAELARKTGTSRNNVSRYLRGARMPLEFGTALVHKLGVNPGWLLAGEGMPYLADITASASDMARDTLELVRAMRAVTQTSLGALAGQAHGRVLRELNDNLMSVETLHDQLAGHSRAIFNRLLLDLEKALAARDRIYCEELFKAAGQVARLCPDSKLLCSLDRLAARYETYYGSPDKAIELQRRVLNRLLANAATFEIPELMLIHDHGLSLFVSGRLEEAMRVLRAGCLLASRRARRAKIAMHIRALAGLMDLEMGKVRRGLTQIQRILPWLLRQPDWDGAKIEGDPVPQLIAGTDYQYRFIFARGMLWAGRFSVNDLIRFMPTEEQGTTSPKHQATRGVIVTALVHYSIWRMEKGVFDEIAPLEAEFASRSPGQFGTTLLQVSMEALARADAGTPADRNAVAHELIARLRAHPNPVWARRLPTLCTPAMLAILETQILRVFGASRDQALERLQEADKALLAIPPVISMDFLLRAIHARNALHLIAPGTNDDKLYAIRNRAIRFFKRASRNGFDCYHAVAEDLDRAGTGAPAPNINEIN